MKKINLTTRPPTDPLVNFAWDIYKGYEQLPDDLTNEERTVIEEHIGRFKQREAESKAAHEARQAEDALRRQRIKTLEANLSPEGRECWDAMRGRGYEDPMHDCRESIRQGIITRYNLRAQTAQLEKIDPKKRTAQEWRELDDLKEDLADCESMLTANQDHLKELLAEREACGLHRDQEAATCALRLLFKFTADKWVQTDIEDKSRALAEEWQRWQNSWQEYDRYDPKSGNKIGTGRAPSSFVEIAEHIRHNLSVYDGMIREYAKRTPVNNAAIASQERCAALEAEQKTMTAQAALAIDAAREQGRREKQSEIDKAKARAKARMHTSR